jgi:hypothetical protein
MTKIINIPTNKEKFFLQYLTLLTPIHKLRHKEIEVLAQLMFYNDLYKHLEEEVRNKMVYDTDTKMRIRQKLKMTDSSFNNNLAELRKKKILVDNILSKGYQIFTNGGSEELTFKFTIQEDTDQ